jgi:predicted exporter
MTTRRLSVIAIWLAGLLICGAVIARTHLSTDMSAFLPRSANPAQQILVDQLREGVVSRLILLAIEGADPDTLAAVSKSMAHDLRANPGLGLVNNGETDALSKDRDVLWDNRYLLSPAVTPEHFSAAALHQALEADIGLLNSDLGLLAKRTIPADPTGEMTRLLETFISGPRPETHDGVWMAPGGGRALLMVQTQAAGFDLNGQQQALLRIEAAFAAARHAIPAAAQTRLIESGPPVFAVHTRDSMKQDVARLSAIATVLVAAVLLLAYRSARVLVLALLPVLSGVIGGIAAVSLSFGFVHGITLGFGVTLIGEAVDYAIYLFTQTEPGAAPSMTLRRIWPTLLLGMLTSVCGFSAMLFSSFTGFAQLGLFTIAGLLIALTVTRFVLPALLPEQSPFHGATLFAVPLAALMRHARAARPVVLGLTLACVVALALHPGRYWETEIASMSPLPAADKQIDDQLRRETGAPDVRYFLIVPAPDRQEALAASERIAARLDRLVAAGGLAGFDFPARLLPSEATQRARQAAIPDPATLAANLAQGVAGTAFRADVFAPFLADAAAAVRQPLLERRDLDGTNLAARVDSLLVRQAHGWTALLSLRGVVNPARLAADVAGFNEAGLLFLDLRTESDRLLDAYLHEALTLSLVGGLVIVALLSVSLRRPRRIAAVLAPLAAAVICTAAVLLVTGGTLSIFNLFGLLLVVAVGSNYCLFFERGEASFGVHRHGAPFPRHGASFPRHDASFPRHDASFPRHGPPPTWSGEGRDGGQSAGNDRVLNQTATTARQRMVASLVLANLCTVIGFGILSFSRFPVLHGIGVTVAIGAFLCLLFGAIVNAPHPRAATGN